MLINFSTSFSIPYVSTSSSNYSFDIAITHHTNTDPSLNGTLEDKQQGRKYSWPYTIITKQSKLRLVRKEYLMPISQLRTCLLSATSCKPRQKKTITHGLVRYTGPSYSTWLISQLPSCKKSLKRTYLSPMLISVNLDLVTYVRYPVLGNDSKVLKLLMTATSQPPLCYLSL